MRMPLLVAGRMLWEETPGTLRGVRIVLEELGKYLSLGILMAAVGRSWWGAGIG